MARIQSEKSFSKIVRKDLMIRKKEKQAEDMFKRVCLRNKERVFQEMKEKRELVRRLKSIFSGARLRALIRLQRFFRK